MSSVHVWFHACIKSRSHKWEKSWYFCSSQDCLIHLGWSPLASVYLKMTQLHQKRLFLRSFCIVYFHTLFHGSFFIHYLKDDKVYWISSWTAELAQLFPLLWSPPLHILLWNITRWKIRWWTVKSDLFDVDVHTFKAHWPYKSFAPALRLLTTELKYMAILWRGRIIWVFWLIYRLPPIHWIKRQMNIQIQRNFKAHISHYR